MAKRQTLLRPNGKIGLSLFGNILPADVI